MTTTIHPIFKNYFRRLYAVRVFWGILLLFAIVLVYLQQWLFLGFAGVSLIYVLALPLDVFLRSQIQIDEQKISGRISSHKFEILWADIRAVKQVNRDGREYLFVGLDNEVFSLPIRVFDDDQLLKNLRAHLPAIAFEEEAYQTIQKKYKADIMAKAISSKRERSLDICLWLFLIVGLGLGIFLLQKGLLSASLMAGLCLIFPGLIGLFLSSGKIEADSTSIKISRGFGRFQMNWVDVKKVVFSSRRETLVLVGEDKQLVIPLLIAGKIRDELLTKIFAFMEKLSIPISEKTFYIPPFYKNTRLPKSESF